MELPEKQLLEALRPASGEWLSRSEIAGRLGKRRLNPTDIAILSMLAQVKKIEEREVPTNAPSGRRFEYRISK